MGKKKLQLRFSSCTIENLLVPGNFLLRYEKNFFEKFFPFASPDKKISFNDPVIIQVDADSKYCYFRFLLPVTKLKIID